MPAMPVPKSSIVVGSGTAPACCAPPMRICATSSTFVSTIATVVVNATLLIRCPLMAVMVKKFSPLVPHYAAPAFSPARLATVRHRADAAALARVIKGCPQEGTRRSVVVLVSGE
jgi:hypothetical protein